MRILLIVWSLSIGGCAAIDLPPAPTDLREYEQIALPALEPLPLTAPQAEPGETLSGQEAACFAGAALDDLERFAAAAHANTEALEHAIAALHEQAAEARALLAAGQSAEALAEIYRALYQHEAGRALVLQIGAGAAALVLLGIGAL